MHNPYDDPAVASLYDVFNPWAPCDDFYLGLVMDAPAALDAGCGTGLLLRTARRRGHTGRLVGLDPAVAMLEVARSHTRDVDWACGDLSTHTREGGFDLVTMTGHAFQELLTDTAALDALTAMRTALNPGGLVAFETRNPGARAWERWTPDHPRAATLPDGRPLTLTHDARPLTPEGLVTFTSTAADADGRELSATVSTLRFVTAPHLDTLLAAAGLRVTHRYGDWDRTPLTPASPEVITLARPA
ncbi:Methyltransferase domain-containing protein [Nocardiopsis flavescens]|uniref:Methyltransferase domain-containing protein n=1 Tax=Nocardiopsis flavescens TaxID=758803 RepID=A0A1M6AK38_9ACTN|nr:class I SAM-dependent methyltransferase [Nocardiopsis flavescens]SHI36836.1 Methyltransferase domain-containing protein [Nocardiopsis flavescens]